MGTPTSRLTATTRGPIAWMARNSVAANLLMAVLLVGGLVVGRGVKQEVFPSFDLDYVVVQVPYPGASPAEVEQGIVLAVEEAIGGVDGVKRINATASENVATIIAELFTGEDADKRLADIKNAVDRITTLPRDAERPVVRLLDNQREVLSLLLAGPGDERAILELAEQLRDELKQMDGVAKVELKGTRPLEIGVEVPQAVLRKHGLTLEAVAGAIAQSALELPGGAVKTRGGEVLLRVAERKDYGDDLRQIVVAARPDGTQLRLGDIATIRDGYDESDLAGWEGPDRAVVLDVFQPESETPITLSDRVMAWREAKAGGLPPGVRLIEWRDQSRVYRQRMELMKRNALQGLVLVLVVLGLFLELRLAFWVTMGIPISFAGSMLLMPGLDVSVNMISTFAFIVVLGMVVDDAIVVGENIYDKTREGLPRLDAAIVGAREVAVPVTFSILTSVVAFMPLLFVPGVTGRFFGVIPIIVIAVLLVSWIESIFVLPAHLAHGAGDPRPSVARGWRRLSPLRVLGVVQEGFRTGLDVFINKLFCPVLNVCLRERYLTLAVGVLTLALSVGWVAGGRIPFSFLPKIDGNLIVGTFHLPAGTPAGQTRQVAAHLEQAAERVFARHGGDAIKRGIYVQTGAPLAPVSPTAISVETRAGSHIGVVQVFLMPAHTRDIEAGEFAAAWRAEIGEIAGVDSLTIRSNMGATAGSPVDVQLAHDDMDTLRRAASELANVLGQVGGVYEVEDGFSDGKPQLDVRARAGATSAGIDPALLGRQLRASFYGVEALRQQRGRNEVRVMVRRPREERTSEADIEQTLIQAPDGSELPLGRAAEVIRGRAYTSIQRADGRRVLNVTAEVDPLQIRAAEVLRSLREDELPRLKRRFPGLSYSFEGERRAQSESLDVLLRGFVMAMVLIFALLAIPFRSYVQPLIVMTAIPFGMVGALMGHMALGYGLDIMSLMGIVALSGVVVNDSLVLIDAANQRRWRGASPFEAILSAGVRRFRPIVLTSLTTFFGLAPMIFERSAEARFLVPMALSLGFGILFATLIVLLLVPALYLVIEDLVSLYGGSAVAERHESTAAGDKDLASVS